jgi:hypothetical protein
MQYLFVAENYNPAITESALRVLKEEAYNLQASSVITPASTEPEKAFAEAWNGQLCIVHPPSWSAASLQNRERLSLRHDRDILEKATYQQIAIAEEHGDKALSDETLMTLFMIRRSAGALAIWDGESKGRVKESLDYAKQYSLHIRWVDARYNQVTLNGWSPPAQLGLLLNQMKTS